MQRVPKRELVDDVGHVWILGLGCGAVRGHVEVARNLGWGVEAGDRVGSAAPGVEGSQTTPDRAGLHTGLTSP